MCSIEDCNIMEVGFTTNNNTERIFNRNVYINYNQFTEFYKTHPCLDTYYSAYLYSNKEVDQAELYGSLYLDFDDQANIENAREDIIHTISYFKIVYKIPNDQMKIYFSGNKGFHLVIPKEVLGIKPDKNLNGIFKSIAEQINNYSTHKTIDMQIYDNRRLFRVPNTINGKTGLYKIRLSAKELLNLSKDQIFELAREPRKESEPNKTFNQYANNQYLEAIKSYERNLKNNNTKDRNFRYKNTIKIVPQCITNILENGAEEGARNITIACLASFYKQTGKTLDEIIEIIEEWNSRNLKPTPHREMITTIKSIFYGNKSYGCSTLRTIVNCNSEKCELKNSKRNMPGRRAVPHAIKMG